ncbi:hypothetical protein SFRURICE_009962 [Spodoptera frugiperda]|nr:hypothetical protein SFRURICE_009962 [Spodoptera frugiperda]
MILTAQLVRWLGNRLPRNMYRVLFPYRATRFVIHKLLFRGLTIRGVVNEVTSQTEEALLKK